MDFFEVIASRRSIRSFDDRPVEEEKIREILEAARTAPSAGNLQGYEIYLVQDTVARMRLASAVQSMDFFNTAAFSLVFCANPDRSGMRYRDRGRNLYAIQDAAIACTQAMLAATALGLGSVWVGAFAEDAVREALDLPKNYIPVAILPIGYPLELPDARSRRPLEDIVHPVK